ncbi:flagellin [Roseomonas alkaliterrae]|jgi:flagellin|uniref:Flagellin n=1 Tax=Neoroseomonas alkaliterrae TaxID=1452450 RepID=A0A840Y7F7_9PROT|nr:flagellin [Neoroseomonas alkaliterrae]MBB5689814.1 flagellin [Neoroseomonas alkaliterrae]MBR0675610.1 flagellin [Neoroseomonas alkaliterrae]
MSLNSVNTNIGAMVALQSLNRTNEALNATQKRVSTGYRVSDAKDDGAAFAVAQSVRADVAGLTAANEQLGGVKGVLDTALAGLRKVSDTMIKVRETLVRLADDTLNADQRAQYEAQYGALRTQIQNFIEDATYNGRSLLSTTPPVGGNITTTRNEAGTTYTLTAVDGLADLVVAAAPTNAAAAQAAIAAGGDWPTINTAIADALNRFGSDARYVDAQIAYNRDKLDSLESGLGALIDADLAKESARLQALQIRQQLGTQSLSIANQAPQSLLSLFRGG